MRKNFFISYARADGSDFATRLHDDLEAARVASWLDVRELRGGSDWDAAIDDALDRSTGLLVVLTPGAVLSHAVKSEYLEALARLLPVIPLQATPCEIPRMLAPLHCIDFRRSYEDGRAALVEHLQVAGANHLQSLRRTLAALEVAQAQAPDPRRFQAKIRGVEARIATWGERARIQKRRVVDGLTEQRSHLRRERARQAAAVRVVGRQPQDVTEYFRDREQERAEILRLLGKRGNRLVSVIGRGGIGKTAVALEVLKDLEHSTWPRARPDGEQVPRAVDGIVYLSTRTTGISLERIFANVARLLGGERRTSLEKTWGAAELTVARKIERLFEAMGEELYVVLLDNLEDTLDDTGHFREPDLQRFFDLALSRRHRIRLLVTSREPIALEPGVQHYDARVELDRGLPVDDAVKLLRDLDAHGEFGLRRATRDELVGLAEMLFGIPRALEVAAGILAGDPFLSVSDLITQFYQKRDAVNDLIEEGYRRLDDEGRRVLEALSVLRRSVPLVAVDFLLEPSVEGLDVPRVARRLARNHILRIDRNDKTLSLHPIDRKFAYSRLPVTGEYSRKSLERRAAKYYENLCGSRDSWASVENPDARVLQFEHLMRAGDYDEASRVLNDISLWLSWYGSASRALRLHRQLDGKVDHPNLLIRHFQGLGSALTVLGPLDEALRWAERAANLARRGDYGAELADVLLDLGLIHRYMGTLETARQCFLEGLERCRATPGDYGLAAHLRQLARVSIYMGRAGDCRRYALEALSLDEADGDRLHQGVDGSILALADWVERRFDEADATAARALLLLEEAGERNSIGYVLNNLGLIRLARKQWNEAEEFLQKARAQGRNDEQPRLEGFALINLAWLHRLRGESELALAAVRASHEILGALELPEARIAGLLGESLEAGLEGPEEEPREAALLLECGREIGTNPDLFDPRWLARSAAETAQEAGQIEVVREAVRLEAECDRRRPETGGASD